MIEETLMTSQTELEQTIIDWHEKFNEYLIALNDVVADMQADSEKILAQLQKDTIE